MYFFKEKIVVHEPVLRYDNISFIDCVILL
jgi:hypothetical protein